MEWHAIDGDIFPETVVDTGRRMESKPILLICEDGRFKVGVYCSPYPKTRKNSANYFGSFFTADYCNYGPFTHWCEIVGPASTVK